MGVWNRKHLSLSLIFSLMLVTTLFQNCGDGFQAIESGEGNLSTGPSGPGSNQAAVSASCNSATPPVLFSGTCLAQTDFTQNLSNFKTYSPQYELYSDGASKQRWVYLPEGAQINSDDPDNWTFPAGTVLWKEFSQQGKRVETRRFEKSASGVWIGSVYLWLDDQSDAELWIGGTDTNDLRYAVNNLGQAPYSLVDPGACMSCHQGASDVALGFSYLQISGTNASIDAFDLDSLGRANFLTTVPTVQDAIAGSAADAEALGYLHANCAHCHSPNGVASSVGFNLQHESGAATLADENAFMTMSGVASSATIPLLDPGDAANSQVYVRMLNGSMPSAGISEPDTAYVGIIQNWINGL